MLNTSLGFGSSIFIVWFIQLFFILTLFLPAISNFSRIWSSACGAFVYTFSCGADLVGSEIYYNRVWIPLFYALFAAAATLSFPKARHIKKERVTTTFIEEIK